MANRVALEAAMEAVLATGTTEHEWGNVMAGSALMTLPTLLHLSAVADADGVGARGGGGQAVNMILQQ